MACKGFIEKFAQKVIDYSSACHSCESRRRLCKNFADEYDHLEDQVLQNYYSNHWATEKEQCNVLMTCLHNLLHSPGEEIMQLVRFLEENFQPLVVDLSSHWACFEHMLPNFLVVVANFNDTSVWLYEDVYDYYAHREHWEPELYYSFKRLYFRDWLKSFSKE